MTKKIKLIIGLIVTLFLITALGISKVEAAEVTEKQTKQLSKGKVEVVTETKKVNGEDVKVLKDVNLDFSMKTKGDVNGDGIVSVEDASYLLMKAVADTLKDRTELSSDESKYADIDSDGMINVKDAQYVLTYYAKKAAGLNPTWEQAINEVNDVYIVYSQNDEEALKYDIHINNNDLSMKALNESQLKEIIEKSDMPDEGKENMKSISADLVKYQEEYKINAVFVMALIKLESNWGTEWGVIDQSTYNWASILGTLNGGFIDKYGKSWNKYNNYSEATENVFKIIANLYGDCNTIQDACSKWYGGDQDADKSIASIVNKFYKSIDVNPIGGNNNDNASSSSSNVSEKSKEYDGTLDFDVNTDHQKSLPKLNENQLKQIVNNSDATQEAKDNMLSVIPDLVKYQDKYKVNAVFIMAVIKVESDWGTAKEIVDSNTYNWAIIYGNLNGGYIDKLGQSWNKYNNFSEATEDLIKIIANSNGNYFGQQKYTIYEIGEVFCGGAWNNDVSAKVQYFYDIINIDIKNS